MAIRNVTQRNAMATAYGAAAPFGALFTADPGTADAATGECTGGAPAYARKALSWGAAAASAITGTATFDVAAATTVTYFGVTVLGTAAVANVRDSVAIGPQTFASQGTYTVTPTYTQT
jgi:hypothetical protein